MPGHEKGYQHLCHEQEIVRGPSGEILATRGPLPVGDLMLIEKERDMPKKPKPKLYSVAICHETDGEIVVSAHVIEALSMRDAKKEAELIIEPFAQDGDMVLVHCKQVTDKYIHTSRKLRKLQESLAGRPRK